MTPDQTCWLCDRPISQPLEIIGQYIAGRPTVAHRRCWQTLGEHELELEKCLSPDAGEQPLARP